MILQKKKSCSQAFINKSKMIHCSTCIVLFFHSLTTPSGISSRICTSGYIRPVCLCILEKSSTKSLGIFNITCFFLGYSIDAPFLAIPDKLAFLLLCVKLLTALSCIRNASTNIFAFSDLSR